MLNIFILHKCCSFEIDINDIILENIYIYHGCYKTLSSTTVSAFIIISSNQLFTTFNIDNSNNNNKCFSSSQSVY